MYQAIFVPKLDKLRRVDSTVSLLLVKLEAKVLLSISSPTWLTNTGRVES